LTFHGRGPTFAFSIYPVANILPFSFESKRIRTWEAENGEIFFYAKDVYVALDLVLRQDSIDRLDECSYKKLIINDITNVTDNQLLNVWLTESGVYEVIINSRKEEAKRFRKWIISEVLPSIRKTGKYELPSVASKKLPTDYLEALKALVASEEEKILLTEQKKVLEGKIEEQEPKVEFYDRILSSDDTIDIGETAKVLKLGYGRNILFQILRREKILMENNLPYQSFIDSGYFTVIEVPYPAGDETRIHLKTLVTQKGLTWLLKQNLKKNS
jgi:anti-repressor protein